MEREFRKLNDEPIEIEYVEDEYEELRDFLPSFWFENRCHYIHDYVKVHNNPWIRGEWPEFIHGIEGDVYYKPLLIEVVDGGAAVNVYQEK